MNIPFISLQYMHSQLRQKSIEAFAEFYDGNNYILGNKVKEFEDAYAKFNGVQYAVGISNGLDALRVCLSALNIGNGDEVIVPSNTYIATVLAVTAVGAIPVFCEPNINTYNINADKIESLITSKTKAILPVHLYGQACNMDAIMQIAEKNNLFIVEDNAQAHGATFNGQLTGTFGHVNATSFYPTKNLGALGDAGAVTTNDEKLADKARLLRNYGFKQKYVSEIAGYNMRLDEFHAAFLLLKLECLHEWNLQRRKIAEYYLDALSEIGDIILPATEKSATHVYHLFVVRTHHRNQLQEYLHSKGIQTAIHYPVPVHLQNAYKYLKYQRGDFPVAEELADTSLSLPIWPGMTEEQIMYVCKLVKEFFSQHG